ncbi:hypothetical protein E7826_03795 [Salmonella enterica]|nr:hypothetical protein [Salmonella enterica]EAO5854648.1 hypothetical protein [Salmonella enterica subsp. enterica serovar Worthington]EAS0584773.1 hypothetical protein [Salmonella enterica subsp. enterica serovar Clackamas]EAO5312369.1 hypothetical protein [Salmonella enterica]EAQ4004648.1 hypothetical protein [Salmonella enterica]
MGLFIEHSCFLLRHSVLLRRVATRCVLPGLRFGIASCIVFFVGPVSAAPPGERVCYLNNACTLFCL